MHRVKLFSFLITLCISSSCIAQDESDDNPVTVLRNGFKGFHAGFYAGVLFPSNYSSSLYDGYGIDTSGNKNNFVNSVMVQRMIVYGMDSVNCNCVTGGPGYSDQIGPAIGVSPDQWSFDSTDMPVVKYTPSFLFGLQLQYGFSRHEGIILNTYFSKVNVTGTFTITTRNKFVNSSLGDSVLYFGLSGQEQRFNLQLGYSRLIGDPENIFGWVAEGGFLFNSTKYLNNYANIGDLKLDLTPFTFNSGYQNQYTPPEYNAIGYGVFGGFGINISTSNYLIQILYSPSYERIGIGEAPEAKLQNAVGLRVYYAL